MSANAMPQRSATSSFDGISVRLTSAFFLVCLAMAVTYLGGGYFCLLVCCACVILNWEWWRLSGVEGKKTELALDVTATVSASIATWLGFPLIAIAILAAGFLLRVILDRLASRPLWSAFGQTFIGLAAVSILWIRLAPEWGFLATLYLFVVVWATDSAAYLAGKTIGGPKLWPSVSPNKTWAGFAGGALAGGLAGGIFSYLLDSETPLLLSGLGIFLSLCAQGGDLLESGAKRAAHKKDASHLIPGHGGLFDRVDGLIVVLIVAAAIILVKDASVPGVSLLVWTPLRSA